MVSSDGLLSLTEALSDCLSALSSIKITAELIKDLKLGNIVASLNHKLETVSADKVTTFCLLIRKFFVF